MLCALCMPCHAVHAVQALIAGAEEYMSLRPRATQPSLRPFFAAIKEDDTIAE